MLVNTNVSIGLRKCFDEFQLKEFSLFQIEQVKEEFSSLDIRCIDNKELIINLKCPICNKKHTYVYSIDDCLKYSVNIGGCEEVGLPVFYIGKNNKIKGIIGKANEVNEKIYAMI